MRPLYGYFRLRHFPCDRPLLLHVCRGFYRKTVSKKTSQNDLIFFAKAAKLAFYFYISIFFNICIKYIFFFLQKFDVGKCIGICSPTPFCIIWDPSSGKCLSSISTSSRCKATAFDTHSFTTPDGKEKMLISIGNCVCA